MTVTYGARCQTVRNIGNFWRMLFCWKASVYKLVWLDLLVFLFLYYALSILYNYLLFGHLKEFFTMLCQYCETQMALIPLSFVLGFYVSNVISRWEKQFLTLPTPDNISIFVSACIIGKDEKSRLMRRSIVRYLNVSFIILMSAMSPPVKKRFPTYEHLVAAGILFDNEQQSLEYLQEKIPTQNLYWVPLIWASNIVIKARKQKKITHDIYVRSIVQKICELRKAMGSLLLYRSISIPLVYTQVVTMAVYTFFLAIVFGRQVLPTDNPPHPIDLYFPLFTILEFLFYMGWLKVAETLVNPYGEDDDDFEINWLIDRNIQFSYAMVDEVHEKLPDLLRDQYWDQVIPDVLPHTPESRKHTDHPPPQVDMVSSVKMSMSSKSIAEGTRLHQRLQDRVSMAELSRRTQQKQDQQQANYVFTVHPQVESLWRRLFSKGSLKISQTEVPPSTFETHQTLGKRQLRTPFTTDTNDSDVLSDLLRGFPPAYEESIIDLEQPQTSGYGKFEMEDLSAVPAQSDDSDNDETQSGVFDSDIP